MSAKGRYFLGADTGRTFTDFVALHVASGALTTFKVPSVPEYVQVRSMRLEPLSVP